MNMNKTLADLIEDFLRYLRVQKGRTLLTVNNYRLYLKRFLTWALTSQLQRAADLTLDKLRDYRLWLSRQQTWSGTPLSSATQNYHLIALRSFANYLKNKNVVSLAVTKITLNPLQQRKILILDEPSRLALLNAVQQSPETTIIKLRDKALIELIASSGLKISEVTALKKEQLRLNANQIEVVRLKKPVTLNLPANTCLLLQNYLQQRTDHSDFVFVRHDRAADNNPGPITPRSIQRSLERYRKLAGLKQKITPHTLRHSFAAQLAAQGTDLETIRQSLGLKHRAAANVYPQIASSSIDQKAKNI